MSVDPKGVAKLLDELNINKAPGSDDLNATVLNVCSNEGTYICIFNAVLARGEATSNCFKFFKSVMMLITDWCHTLASVVNLTLGHLLVSNINKQHFFADCKRGFPGQRSCETHLVQFVHNITIWIDSNRQF